EPDRIVNVAEGLGHRRLEPPIEDVLLRPGQEVELVPHAPEEGQRLIHGGPLLGGEKPSALELPERAGAEAGRGEPDRGVDVAEPARRLLDVRLLDVDRSAVLAVALVALG